MMPHPNCDHPTRDRLDPTACAVCGADLIAERAPFQRGGE